MVALQIRDVPESVRDALAERARIRGQSLQSFLLSLVTDESRRSENTALLDRFAGRSDGSRLTASQAARLLDETRKQRGTEPTGAAGRSQGATKKDRGTRDSHHAA